MSERAQALEAALRELATDLERIVWEVSTRDGDATARQHLRAEAVRWALDRLAVEAPAVGVSPQPDEGVRAENERLKKALRAASDEIRQVSVRLSNVALSPDDITALFASLKEPASLSPVEPTEVEQDQLKSAAAELWWMGRDSVKDLPTATATGPQLRDRCFVDIQDSRILTPLGKDTTT